MGAVLASSGWRTVLVALNATSIDPVHRLLGIERALQLAEES